MMKNGSRLQLVRRVYECDHAPVIATFHTDGLESGTNAEPCVVNGADQRVLDCWMEKDIQTLTPQR